MNGVEVVEVMDSAYSKGLPHRSTGPISTRHGPRLHEIRRLRGRRLLDGTEAIGKAVDQAMNHQRDLIRQSATNLIQAA